jgi:hypothetical protein
MKYLVTSSSPHVYTHIHVYLSRTFSPLQSRTHSSEGWVWVGWSIPHKFSHRDLGPYRNKFSILVPRSHLVYNILYLLKQTLWAPVTTSVWTRHTLFCRCPVLSRTGLPPNNLRTISRHRFHNSQITSGCLSHICRRASYGKTPTFVWKSLLRDLPWNRLVPLSVTYRHVSLPFSGQKVLCPCGGDRNPVGLLRCDWSSSMFQTVVPLPVMIPTPLSLLHCEWFWSMYLVSIVLSFCHSTNTPDVLFP